MKKYCLVVALIGWLMTTCSCNKFLNTEPESFLTPEKYYSADNITSALAGVYSTLMTQGVYGSYYWGTIRATTDEHFYGGGRTITTGIDVYNFDYGNAPLNTFWSSLYTGIERANELMKYTDTTGSVAMKAAYGEALFLRGYYYYLLVSNFGGVPLRLEAVASADNLNLKRAGIREVYEQVIADMTKAEGLVYTIEKLGSGSRVSKTTVQGILARVYLTMAGEPLKDESQYANALLWAKKVQASGSHRLNTDYRQVFINMAQNKYETGESMWEADFYYDPAGTVGLNTGGWVGSYQGIKFNSSATTDGSNYIYNDTGYCYSFLWVTKKLYDLYNASDYRRDWNMGSYAYNVYSSNPGSVYRTAITDTFKYDRPVAKFRRNYELVFPKHKNLTPINFPLLRYADVLLMLAEAELHVNGATSVALNAINEVRERGYGLTLTSGAPAKAITLLAAGSGYSGTSLAVGDDNRLDKLAFVATVASGKVTALTLRNGGHGYTDGQTVTLAASWYPNYYYAANTQIAYNGNLYKVSTAGITSAVPPTHTSGSSAATSTGIPFAYVGVPATATVTTVKKADADLTSVSLKDIQDERARELCFEGLRTVDLIRWGVFVSSLKEEAVKMLAHGVVATNTNRTQNALGFTNVSSRNLLLPIPSGEMSVNKLATQNPGW